jgi:hypothetical protein
MYPWFGKVYILVELFPVYTLKQTLPALTYTSYIYLQHSQSLNSIRNDMTPVGKSVCRNGKLLIEGKIFHFR